MAASRPRSGRRIFRISLLTLPHRLPARPPAGRHNRVLLFSLLRFSTLLAIGATSYQAFSRRSPGSSQRAVCGLDRHAHYRVAIYLQLLWVTSELILGSASLAFYPFVTGEQQTPPAFP